MTRLNIVPVETPTQQHLVAAYRELPRVFGLVERAIQRGEKPNDKRNPTEYTLGKGHVRMFYNKLGFLADYQKQLVAEMLKRNYKPQHVECLRKQWEGKIPECWWGNYEVTEEALRINQARINARLKGE